MIQSFVGGLILTMFCFEYSVLKNKTSEMACTMPRPRLWKTRNIGLNIYKNKKDFYPKVSPSFVSSLFLRKLGEPWMIQACLWIPNTRSYDQKFNRKSSCPGLACHVRRAMSKGPCPAGHVRGATMIHLVYEYLTLNCMTKNSTKIQWPRTSWPGAMFHVQEPSPVTVPKHIYNSHYGNGASAIFTS